MKRLGLAVMLLATPASDAATPLSTAQPRCRAIDGDTLACGAERIRIIGLDAPEMHARCPAELDLARASRDRLEALIAPVIAIKPRGRDRYRRTLAVVLDATGRNVATTLISEGLARPYDGRGRRAGWCR